MSIKDKLINEYPLTKKVDCSFECYQIIKRRFVIFYDEKINKENAKTLLDVFNKSFNITFHQKKSVIVVAYTDEQFDKKDLVFFNGEDTFVVYYLINEKTNEIYFNDESMFFFCVCWKKIVKRFNEILNNSALQEK